MIGGNGLSVPHRVADLVNRYLGMVVAVWWSDVPKQTLILALLLVTFCPNSNELVKRLKPNRKYAVVLGILLVLGVLSLSQITEFLYFQF